jgi:hypothetical protein
MRILNKIIALFSSVLLLFIGILPENNNQIHNSEVQNTGFEAISSYCSIEKPDLFLVNTLSERLVITFRHLPLSILRNQTDDLYTKSLFLEKKKFTVNSVYLFYPWKVYRKLTTSSIIFPYNYFW